jgi:hypothetical protein
MTLARIYFAIIFVVLSTSACKKEDTVFIPLHAQSTKWIQKDFPWAFVNQSSDTLQISSAQTTRYRLSDLVDLSTTEGFIDYEIVEQRFSIDAQTSFALKLRANLQDSTYLREDLASIHLSWNALQASTYGYAWPKNYLEPPALFFKTFTINGTTYNNVYVSETIDGGNRLTMYYNVSTGLIGFERSGEIYNRVE